MLVPYQVDVPMQRWPFANWAVIAITTVATVAIWLTPDTLESLLLGLLCCGHLVFGMSCRLQPASSSAIGFSRWCRGFLVKSLFFVCLSTAGFSRASRLAFRQWTQTILSSKAG